MVSAQSAGSDLDCLLDAWHEYICASVGQSAVASYNRGLETRMQQGLDEMVREARRTSPTATGDEIRRLVVSTLMSPARCHRKACGDADRVSACLNCKWKFCCYTNCPGLWLATALREAEEWAEAIVAPG